MKVAAAAPLTPGLRRFLYFTAALTGAAILVVEILGAKMLSPYVGSSHFVWTAQIAVTLVSLAVGYYFGGWLVDRSPSLHRLYICIALAALYLGISVPACEKAAYAFLKYKLATGALFSSMFLFFVPLTLLATTGPFLIRVLAQSFEGVGGQAGRLSAISTFGSVFGTVSIGYFILPYLPNSTTMYLTAGILLILCVTYFAIWGRAQKSLIATATVAAILLAATYPLNASAAERFKQMKVVYHGNSNFGEIMVLEHPSNHRRFYLNDFLVQNTYDPTEKLSLSLFTYMLHELAWAYGPPLKSALAIGMGIGIVPRAMAAEGVQMDVVEINPEIVPVAEKYFDFDPSKVNLIIGDGRFYLNQTQKKYDAILLDAFLGDSSPSHLMTKEAFSEMARLLGPDGVLVINSFADFRPGRDYLLGSLDKTLRAAFKHVRIHAPDPSGNVFFAASQRELTLKPRVNVRFPQYSSIPDQYQRSLSPAAPPDPSAGVILTDDFNPVEFYDAEVRESFRRAIALDARTL